MYSSFVLNKHTEVFKLKYSKEVKPRPTLEQVQQELRGTFVAVGALLNETFYPGSGSSLIGVPITFRGADAIATVNLEQTVIGRNLPIYYAYAYDGVLVPGYEREVEQDANEMIERLTDFMLIFHTDSSYFDLCLDVAGLDVSTDCGHLDDMIARLSARRSLDDGSLVAISEIALLADMAERSVKNAANADGAARLAVDKNGMAENNEARRWLSGRRGFVPTQRKSFPANLEECPDQLNALEIPSFVHNRISLRFAKDFCDHLGLEVAMSPGGTQAYEEYPETIQLAAKEAGLSPETIHAAMHQPLRINPEDCAALAKALAVDPVWFTMQVMTGLFPTQMDMLLNPSHYNPTADAVQIEGNSVEIILTEAMIKHGYLDLPTHAKSLFPDDCFGTRNTGDTGKCVELHYGDHVEATDIRIKSEQTVSPRKRFSAWYQKELSATAGDRIRITRTAERSYQLIHLPK